MSFPSQGILLTQDCTSLSTSASPLLKAACRLRKSAVQLPAEPRWSARWAGLWGGRPAGHRAAGHSCCRCHLSPDPGLQRGVERGGRGVVRDPAHTPQARTPHLGGIVPERGGRDAGSVASVLSDSFWPHGRQPIRLLCSWGFSRQEYQSGLPCPPPGDLPGPGSEPVPLNLLHWQEILYPLTQSGKPFSYRAQRC